MASEKNASKANGAIEPNILTYKMKICILKVMFFNNYVFILYHQIIEHREIFYDFLFIVINYNVVLNLGSFLEC